jgi:hypothetical protein
MVVKGTAPDDFLPQMKKLRIKLTPKTTAGKKREVVRAARVQFVPLRVLYSRPP